jgi:hypothetical protein
MPGPLVHIGLSVSCAHGGQATPVLPNPRVTVMGQATITVGAPAYAVAGCPLNGAAPCASATWYTGTVRVRSLGLPLAIMTGTSACTPTASPLVVVATQPIRVMAT